MNVDLKIFENVPIESYVLQHAFRDYHFPKNKISTLEKDASIYRIKKGLYVVSEKITGKKISRELIANHLYGPSYISLETALSYHSLIPERVFEIRSITTKRSKSFKTKFGLFNYTMTSSDYFTIGVQIENPEKCVAFLIATPTKALCDLIANTRHLRIQSLKAMQAYLLENLRIEPEHIKYLNVDIVHKCIPFSKKKKELHYLAQVITKYQPN